jgi:Ca2+-binding EF-hand superfamily protein
VLKFHLPLAAVVALGAAAPALATAAAQPAAGKPAPKAAQAAQAAPNRATLQKNLDANFKAIDTNGDGTLSAAELQAAEGKVQQQRLGAVRGKVEAEFNKLDTNKDGQLSKAEFMAVAPNKAASPPNGANLLAQLDKNKDGKVTPDEYRAPILSRFDKLDTNHDGTISAAERQTAQASAKR